MIVIENLQLNFGQHHLSMKCFELAAGQRIHLEGSSGSGKSTFFKALIGLHPLEFSSYHIDERDRKAMLGQELRSLIHYIPQHISFYEATGRDVLETPKFFKAYQQRDLLDPMVLLKKFVECPAEFLQRETIHYSGGQRQVLALVRSLMLKPQYLILDESLSAMDQQLLGISLRVIEEYAAGCGLLYSSHHGQLFQDSQGLSIIGNKIKNI